MEHNVADEKEGIVYLFTFPRNVTKQCLNLSPFALTVESWMRLNHIPYELVGTWEFSKTTRMMPYIHYNGEYQTDSQFIIEYLAEKFNLDPNHGLTEEESAITVAFQRMMDESTFLTCILHRYIYHSEAYAKIYKPYPDDARAEETRVMLDNIVKDRTYHHGIGRKTEEEVARIGKKDVQAFAKFLGTKQFLLGDRLTLIDCVAFSHLCNCLTLKNMNFPHEEVLKKEGTNLLPYLERIKEKLWPDWDTIVDMGVFTYSSSK